MKTVVFDIEANGFLMYADRVWCIATQDFNTGEERTFPSADWINTFRRRIQSLGMESALEDLKKEIKKGVDFLLSADVLIGHNICLSDIPFLEMMFDVSFENKTLWDTLIAARMLVNNEHDRFSLEHFGKFLGEPKGDFDNFEMLTPEMLTYCQQDVRTTVKLTRHLLEKKQQYNVPAEAFRTDMKFAYILSHQVRSGFRLDIKRAKELVLEYESRIDKLTNELSEIMPLVVNDGTYTQAKQQGRVISENDEVFVYKTSKKGDVKTAKIKYDEPNPNSKLQVVEFFKGKYGWAPTEFTDKGSPKIDETILKGLKYPEANDFIELFTAHKKKSQLHTSRKDQQGWLQSTIGDRVHGTIHVNGAVTGRCTHSQPNLAQVDKELREVWIPSDGNALISCDASSLEIRGLAHFLAPYDNKRLASLVASDADIHTSNQQALGFKDRGSAKTFLYALMYGAGDIKLGTIAVEDGNTPYTSSSRVLRKIGADKRVDIEGSLAGLSTLTGKIKDTLLNRSYLLGLDRRPLFPRSEHSALNTLIQGAGAHIMKIALNIFWKRVRKFKYKEDWQLVANVHDEIVFEARPEIAEEMGKHCVESIVEAGKVLNFMCPLDAKYQIGANWAAIH